MSSHLYRLIIVLTTILCACSANKNPGSIQAIDLTGSVSNEIFKLSDIATDIEYVRLETTPDCYIQQVRSFSVSDDYILVWNMNMDDNTIYLFTRQGKFLRQISRHGRGPGEFNFINQVYLSKDQQGIVLFTSPYLYTFNMEGELTGTVKFDDYPSKVNILGDHYLTTYGYSNNIKNDSFSFNLTDRNGKIERQFFHFSESRFNTNQNLQIIGPYNFHDTLSFFTRRMDTIYGIDPDLTIRPRYYFKQNNWSVEENVPGQPEHLPPTLSVLIFREMDDYFLIRGLKLDRIQNFVYSKKDRTIWKIKGMGIPNDIDGGPDFWSDLSNSDFLYQVMNPWLFLNPAADSVRETVPCKYPRKAAAYQQFASAITEESNPVLVIVTLKNK